MESRMKSLHLLRRFLVVSIFSIFILIFLPPTIIFLLPFIIPRYLVSLCARLLKPSGLGKMLTATSASHAIRQEKAVLSMVLQGQPDLERIKSEFTTKILHAKDEINGGLLYPELTQTVVSWMGYLFWKNVSNFQLPIKFHKQFACEQLDTREGSDFLGSLTVEKYNFGSQVLWDVLIIPGKNEFSFVMRIHHAVCDGLSLIKMLDKGSSPQLIEQTAATPKSSGFGILRFCLGLLRMPWDLAKYWEVVMRTWSTPDIFNDHSPLKGSLTFAGTKPFYFPDIKRIALSDSISVTGVVISIIAAGLRNQLIKKYKMVGGNVILYPVLAGLNSSRKLRNTAPMAFVELPLQEPDPIERMRQIDNQLRALRNSAIPIFTEWMFRLWGCQFPPLLRLANTLNQSGQSALVFSNFPLNRAPFKLFGHQFLRRNPSAFGVAGSKAILLSFTRSGDDAIFDVSGDSGMLNPTEANAFFDAIVSEMCQRLDAINNADKGQFCIQMD